MIQWLLSEFGGYLAGAVALLAALWGYGARQRAKGRQQATAAAEQADAKRAAEIREDKDDALRKLEGDIAAGPGINERLRRLGRLRDYE